MIYATCPRCHREMTPGGSCKPERHVFRWGEGETWGDVITWRCHDCFVRPGGWHHYQCALRHSRKTGEQL